METHLKHHTEQKHLLDKTTTHSHHIWGIFFWLINCCRSQKIFSPPLTCHHKSTSKHDMQTLRQIVRRGGRIIPCVYSLFAVLMSCFFGVRAVIFFAIVTPHFWVLSHSTSKISTSPGSELCHGMLSSHYHNSTQSPRLLPHHTKVVTTWQDDTLHPGASVHIYVRITTTLMLQADTTHVDKSRSSLLTTPTIDAMNRMSRHDVTPCSSICRSHRTDIVHIKLRQRHDYTSSITVNHRDITAANTTFTAHGKDHWSVHEDTSTEHVARASSSFLKPSHTLRNQVLFCLFLLSLTFLLPLFANSFTPRAAIRILTAVTPSVWRRFGLARPLQWRPSSKAAAVSATPPSEW